MRMTDRRPRLLKFREIFRNGRAPSQKSPALERGPGASREGARAGGPPVGLTLCALDEKIMDLHLLSLALGSSWAAGINLYATVLLLGLLNRYDIITLPHGLQSLSHVWVLITVGILLLIEFVVDKIPYVDSTWDAIHTFIRVPAGAVLAAGAFADVPAHIQVIAALLGGAVSLVSHGAKASTRMAINTSPEPFSNWLASFTGDALVVTVIWLATKHPLIALIVVAGVLALSVWLIIKFIEFASALAQRLARIVSRPG